MFHWFGIVGFTSCTRVDAFALHLRDGRLMGSRCLACDERSFPPRADCAACMGRTFEFVEISGRGVLHTFTRVVAPPAGFARRAPYTLGLVDLEEGGRALAVFGETIDEAAIAIDMPLQLVPHILEDSEELKVIYRLERPGTRWSKVGGADSRAVVPPPAVPAAPEEAAR
jgi:uncharacterized protein